SGSNSRPNPTAHLRLPTAATVLPERTKRAIKDVEPEAYGGEGGVEHDPQQSGLQLADSTLPGGLSMPRLPWLLGPYWPMVEIDVVALSRADSAPHLLHFFPGKCCGERFCESGAEKIVGRVGSKFFRRIT